MSEQPRKAAVVVGIFVSVGVAILAGGVLAVGDLNDTFSRKIEVSAVFQEVNGLKAGDNIWFSGVKVGRVDELRFEPGSRVAVDMKIDRAASAFIRNDVLAKIGSDGLIGSKLVVLYEGSAAAPFVKEGDVLTVGEGLSTDAMMETFQQNNTNLLAITTDLKALTAGLLAGDGTAGRLFSDEALAAQIAETVTSLQAASAGARSTSAHLSSFTAELNRPGGLPHELVTDEQVFASLAATATRLEEVATDAAGVVEGLARSTSNPDTTLGLLLNDEQAGGDVKATLANLSTGSRLLSEDLEAVQHNFLLRGFFKKKEKAEAKAARDTPEPDVADAR